MKLTLKEKKQIIDTTDILEENDDKKMKMISNEYN